MAGSYDRYLVPILFEAYAAELVSRLPSGFVGAVLELACGTGVVTRELVKRMAMGGKIVATDLSPKMLEFAQAHTPASASLTWQQADGQELPFEAGTFDAVLCQFGAMFFPDKVAAFREAKRVLKPEGRLIFSVWGEMPDNPIFHSMELGLRRLFPNEPTPILPTPSNMADPDQVSIQLMSAGFHRIDVDRVEFPVRGFPALDVFLGFAHGTPISTFLKEGGLSVEEAQQSLLPWIANMIGDPLDTSMAAFVYEAGAL